MTRLARRVAVLLAVLVAVAALPGCAAVDAVVRTTAALESAGFQDPDVTWQSNDGDEVVLVSWASEATTFEDVAAEERRAAGVVWDVAPVRFDAVVTDPAVPGYDGTLDTTRRFPRDALERAHGPRDPSLDRPATELLGGRRTAYLALGAFLVLAAAAVVGTLLLVRASRRRRERQAAWWRAQWQQGYPPPQQPPPPYAPPPYPPPYGQPPVAAPRGMPPGMPRGPVPDDPWRAPPG